MNATKDEELIRARTRQANADAALKELRFKERSGVLVNREDYEKKVAHEWADAVYKVKVKILGIEGLAPMLEGLTIKEMSRVLKQKAREILNELSDEFK